ncbi:MAG: response regulator [Balneola sp.]|nr:response regulator [Balneola sp.]MBO6651263.1 response regulator [Balneola sp.]MBO6800252.1 response regulator [Balneola sp.]MBO6869734.1 response regulator [Balneola sp.]
MGLKNILPTKDKSEKIEILLFEIAIFLTILVFLFWTGFSFYAGYQTLIKAIFVFGFVAYTGIYIAQKKSVSFNIMSSIYFGLSFGIMAFAWLPGGGITGAIIQFIILIFISGLLVLPIRAYLVFILLTAFIVIGFAIYEYFNPGVAVPYSNEIHRIRDISIASIISILVLGFSLFTFKRSYVRDRESLGKAINDIQVEKVKAESADKAKSQFLATISHEMRTPLNGIVGISELLGETDLNPEQVEMVKNLSYSSNMLHSLISDVLDLTTIEDENLELNENKFHLESEIKDILEIFRPKIDSRKAFLHLHHEHDSSIPKVLYGDISRIRQVLVNLVNNGIKFTNDGSVIIQTKLLKREDGIATIQFSVSDTGVGISKEDQDKLFTKFFRTRLANTIEGTGLGLTISKRLVELMGGEISFTSQLKKGSTFSFELPLSLEPKTPEKLEASVNEDDLSGLKILIAEDVPINQMVLSKMLKNLGIENIDIVDDGKQALEAATNGENDYDFILMDIQMPKLDGSQASRRIIEFYRGDLPFKIIAVTANVMKDDFVLYRESGMVDVLSKPVNIKMLSHTLHKHLN